MCSLLLASVKVTVYPDCTLMFQRVHHSRTLGNCRDDTSVLLFFSLYIDRGLKTNIDYNKHLFPNKMPAKCPHCHA